MGREGVRDKMSSGSSSMWFMMYVHVKRCSCYLCDGGQSGGDGGGELFGVMPP